MSECLEKLANANSESNATMLSLLTGVQADSATHSRKVELLEAGQKRTRQLLVMVAVALALMTIIGIANAINIYEARRNAAIAARTAENAAGTYNLLLDCLNPEGECGKRNAKQSRAFLDEIALTERLETQISKFQRRVAAVRPWLANARRSHKGSSSPPAGNA